MWDIAEITQWVSEVGDCLFFRTDAGATYALTEAANGEVHIIPLPDEAVSAIDRAEEAEKGTLVSSSVPHSSDPMQLMKSLQEKVKGFSLPEGTMVKFANESYRSAWTEIENWFQDTVYDDAIKHYIEIQEDLSAVLDDGDDDPINWTEEDIHRYQYIYLPVLNQLFGAYTLNGDVFTESKEHNSPLYSSCSRLYSAEPFLIIADDSGYPALYSLNSTEQEALELIQVGDWEVLVEGAIPGSDD